MYPLISFRGKLGYGKSSAARYLVTRHGYTHVAFANPLKVEVYLLLASNTKTIAERGIVIDTDGTPITLPNIVLADLLAFGQRNMPAKSDAEMVSFINAHKVELRSLMQYWATEVRRAKDDEYWTKRGFALIYNALANGQPVVIDDARFENEIGPIMDVGGIHIYVTTNPEIAAKRLAIRDGRVARGIVGHESERLAEASDPRNAFIVDNDGDLSDTYAQIDAILANSLPKRLETAEAVSK